MSDVSVVILNYNGKSLLEKFLGEVIRHSPGAQIVVADNGSSDDSIPFVESNFPQVRVIRISSNLGFCAGYNFALQQITTPLTVLLNSDVLVTPNWLTPMVQIIKQRDDVAAMQPKILSYNQRDRFEYAGAAGGFIDSLGYPFCRGRVFDFTETDQGQYNDTRPVFWATGACLLVRTNLFREIGGFDEDFFAHMEEIDLCWRLRRRGMEVFYCGDSTIYHIGGATLAAGNPRKVYYNFRNGLFLIIKHFHPRSLLWKLPLRLMLDWVAAIVFLFGHPRATMSVFSAHASVLAIIGKTLAKRRTLGADLPYHVTQVYKGSVVWNYFLRNQKTFRELKAQ
jgi:GT2 family glycosyltransferase